MQGTDRDGSYDTQTGAAHTALFPAAIVQFAGRRSEGGPVLCRKRSAARFPDSAYGYVSTSSQSPKATWRPFAEDMMADTPGDSAGPKRVPVPTWARSQSEPAVRRRGPRIPSTGHDSLPSILGGIEELADDLREHLSLADQVYAQRCADLAHRLRKNLKPTGLERTQRGEGR